MGKKDITQHSYLSNPRRYADVWNALAFNGKQVIKWENLSECDSTQTYSANMVALKKTADIIKKLTPEGHELAILITENQDSVDYSIIIRTLFEEALAYHLQAIEITRRNRDSAKEKELIVSDNSKGKKIKSGEYLYRFNKNDRLKPVATLVLYWGTDEWDAAETLYDMLDFSGMNADDIDLFKEFIPNYRIKAININHIPDAELLFQDTGLRTLVGILNRRNNAKNLISYVEANEEMMDSESKDMAMILLGSKKLKNHFDSRKRKGDVGSMCKAINDLFQDGINSGKIETYVGLINDGEYTIEKAAARINLSPAEFIAKAESLGFTFKYKPA